MQTDKKIIRRIIENVKETEKLESIFRARIGSHGREIIPVLVNYLKNNKSRNAERLLKFIALGIEKDHINPFKIESRLFNYGAGKYKNEIFERIRDYYLK